MTKTRSIYLKMLDWLEESTESRTADAAQMWLAKVRAMASTEWIDITPQS